MRRVDPRTLSRRIALIILAAMMTMLLSLGCSVRLPGLHDVELDYEATTTGDGAAAPGVPSPRNAIPLALQIELRLLRARLPATVAPNGSRGVRITVDEQYVDAVEHALAWYGGLTIYRLDAQHVLGPQIVSPVSSSSSSTRSPSPSDALRVAETTEDDTHRLLYDASPRKGADHLRVAHKKPLFDFAGARVEAQGKTLVVPISSKDAAPIETKANELGDEVVAITRGVNVVWLGLLRDCFVRTYANTGQAAIVIPRGTDLYAYPRARREARLLGPPPFTTPVKVIDRRSLPTNGALASGCILFPLFAGLLWLVFVRRFDRAKPEPWWLVLATCFLGGLSGELAGFVERQLRLATPYLDPDVMQLDLSALVFPITLLVYTLTVGAVEEGAKLLAAWSLAMHRREFDEPVDGIIYAAAAAIGFAVDENIAYFAGYRLGGGLVASRSLDCIAGHTLLAAIWGYALGKKLVVKSKSKSHSSKTSRGKGRVLPFFALAALLHGAMDTSIVYHVPHAGVVYILVLSTIFILLLRKALRWGSVDEVRGEAPLSSQRLLFRTGGGAPFAAAIVAMYLVGTLLQYAGRVVDADHRRVTFALLVLMCVLVVALIVAAYGVVRAMTLHVAVDDLGVTFAGALRRWAAIRDLSRVGKSGLVVHSSDGDLTITGASESTAAMLEGAILDRLKEQKRKRNAEAAAGTDNANANAEANPEPS